MKAKLSPTVIGMFVLGALLLGVVGFLSFGGSNIFSKPSRFFIYFDESVSGLDPGAAVKVTGVRIGRVAAVNVRYDAATRKSLVQTVCEIDRNVLSDPNGKMIDLTNPAQLEDMIDRGLRAKLNLTGITGLLFVELDFEDPRKYPPDPKHMTEIYPVVPSIPSPIAAVQADVVEIVANIKKVDFPGLAKDIRALLTASTQKVNELDLKNLAERVGRAADGVQAFVGSPEAKQTFANLNSAINDARAMLTKLDAQVGPAGDEFRKTLTEAQQALKTIDGAAQTTQRFVQEQGSVGDDVRLALRQVADAAASLERLADALERNPSSLLVGKKKPSAK